MFLLGGSFSCAKSYEARKEAVSQPMTKPKIIHNTAFLEAPIGDLPGLVLLASDPMH